MSDDEARDAAIDRLSAERACARLVRRYFALIDGGRAAEVVDLLGPAPVVEAAGRRWEGRAAIAPVMQARQTQTDRRTRHLVADLVVEADGDEATATATLLVFALHGEQPTQAAALSALEMGFARVDGCWTIQLHRSIRLAQAPA